MSKKKKDSAEVELIKQHIITLFRKNYNDSIILQALIVEGVKIHRYQLKRWRLELGLTRRITVEEREARYDELKAIIQAELDKGGIEGFGRGLVKTHFRGLQITASRDMIYEIIAELDPDRILCRRHDLNRGKNEFVVKGPDWGWHIDQHDKFKLWGFQIYAAIDTYSRKIMWTYVGIANRTAHSVLGQFLKVFREKGYQPRVITSDQGGEVPFLAEVHYSLARAIIPMVPFEKLFRFGTTLKNQRIESWWGQLSKSRLIFWRV